MIVSERQVKYNKQEFQVGQIVYIEQVDASAHYLKDTVGKVTEEVVEKVGTKYITTSRKDQYRYSDGLIANSYPHDYMLHLTKEDAELSSLTKKLKKIILSKTKLNLLESLTLSELETISDILTSAEERTNGGN